MNRLIKIGIFISFLICYVDFGHDGAVFVGEIEYKIIVNLKDSMESFSILFFLISFLGQLIIFISIFKNNDLRKIFLGTIMLSVIVLLIFILGLFTTNIKIIISTIPFISISIIYFYRIAKSKTINN
jgi:hypothetical protein